MDTSSFATKRQNNAPQCDSNVGLRVVSIVVVVIIVVFLMKVFPPYGHPDVELEISHFRRYYSLLNDRIKNKRFHFISFRTALVHEAGWTIVTSLAFHSVEYIHTHISAETEPTITAFFSDVWLLGPESFFALFLFEFVLLLHFFPQ